MKQKPETPFHPPSRPKRAANIICGVVMALTMALHGAPPAMLAQGGGHGHDGVIGLSGLKHDSRDTLYRTPGGAVPAGTEVTLRLRSFHDDISGASARLVDVNSGDESLSPMALALAGAPCFEAELSAERCDYWETSLTVTAPDNFWYRFVVRDGAASAYYADDTAALDGGIGKAGNEMADRGYALMFYTPDYQAPAWARAQVIYQIFPDRFANGDPANDPKTGEARYGDTVVAMPWGALPEGYCRNYADSGTNCPARFPPDAAASDAAVKESPRGRDYFGGDLQGVINKLDYLQALGVTTIYFNPIFAAQSNHRYDTADYLKIDPSLGSNDTFKALVAAADKRGMRVILDGVFNHMSSDSPNFDRYHHTSGDKGACEAAGSQWRSWFVFHPPTGDAPAACAPGAAGGADTYYDGWFGFDSIPVLKKDNPALQKYFLEGPDSVTQTWLRNGAAGWRLDVMGDASFPAGYWEKFRASARAAKPDALIIGELWQKDSTLLRNLRGDRADSTMNYRLRDAVLGLLTPGAFDAKGFPDSGRVIKPSEFASRIASIQEDYPHDVFYSLMNMLDSHDTERLLWTLTPGAPTPADKAGGLAEGKQRMRLASLIQFTMPGAPTVYYGDEVALSGGDDPDDRRTYPWPDGEPPAPPGVLADNAMLAHYSGLAALRTALPALVEGGLQILLADDASGVLAYGRKTDGQAALVLLNRDTMRHIVRVPVAGYLPNKLRLAQAWPPGLSRGAAGATVNGGMLQVTLEPLSGVVLSASADLAGPAAPAGLDVASAGNARVGLRWTAAPGAAGYNVYRSPLPGGGWARVNTRPLTRPLFDDRGLPNAVSAYYAVRALDAAGNEGPLSNAVMGLPRLTIERARLIAPPVIAHVVSTLKRTAEVRAQVVIAGVTRARGATPGLLAQLGVGPQGSDPATSADWVWSDAAFGADVAGADEFQASLVPETPGAYDYAFRFSVTQGSEWLLADLDGSQNGYAPAQAGRLTVAASADTSAPAVPGHVRVLSASPAGIDVAWDAVEDATLAGYEVLRAEASGGFARVARVNADTHYVDVAVRSGATYRYAVRAMDQSFNRGADSAAVSASAAVRSVTATFTLNAPAGTPADKPVYIAGYLDRLDSTLPQWNPGGVALTQASPTRWTVTLTGTEGVALEYKYALGSWDYVEKDGACAEVGNRQITLNYGADGKQAVTDSVSNWRNVAPCGN